mmetsp:Transcript_21843/g.62021  ORF Transcript_21843/g.62021 Transcript_21843/m.62021 type:complete len:161 (-) Transcript_21843:15-497(-)
MPVPMLKASLALSTLALFSAVASFAQGEEALTEAMVADDGCGAKGTGECALSALQRIAKKTDDEQHLQPTSAGAGSGGWNDFNWPSASGDGVACKWQAANNMTSDECNTYCTSWPQSCYDWQICVCGNDCDSLSIQVYYNSNPSSKGGSTCFRDGSTISA